jgi:lipoyl(octanoyl) transferase
VIATAHKRTLDTLVRCDLPLTPYRQALELQRMLHAARCAGLIADTLLFLEHPPTYTRGRRAASQELPAGEQRYHALGIEVFDTDRGGRVTYHGPGQLVGYAIIAVADVVAHVRALERALICALGQLGIEARSRAQEGPDYTGVWVAERKIASIGVHVAGGVATHGFALNVDNDLEPFSWIIPCGLAGVLMTSVARELERAGESERTGEHGREARFEQLRSAIHAALARSGSECAQSSRGGGA